MKACKPPALATWLLENLGSDPRNEQIVGDLMEQYADGRTRAWYWRQVTAAILASLFEQIASHKLLALRALLVGWLAWYFLKEASVMALRAAVMPWSIRLPVLASLFWWTVALINCFITGWIVGRFCRASRVAVLLLFSFTVFLWREELSNGPFVSMRPGCSMAGSTRCAILVTLRHSLTSWSSLLWDFSVCCLADSTPRPPKPLARLLLLPCAENEHPHYQFPHSNASPRILLTP